MGQSVNILLFDILQIQEHCEAGFNYAVPDIFSMLLSSLICLYYPRIVPQFHILNLILDLRGFLTRSKRSVAQ